LSSFLHSSSVQTAKPLSVYSLLKKNENIGCKDGTWARDRFLLSRMKKNCSSGVVVSCTAAQCSLNSCLETLLEKVVLCVDEKVRRRRRRARERKRLHLVNWHEALTYSLMRRRLGKWNV